MSTLREAKPDWSAIPRSLQLELGEVVGSMPISGEVIWGSYSPSVSLRVKLADGRQVFVKGSYPGQEEFGHRANRREVEVLESLPLLARVAPHFLGSVEREGWFLAVFECLQPVEPTLPWTREKVAAVLERVGQVQHLYPVRTKVPALIHDTLADPFCGTILRGEEGWGSLNAESWPQVMALLPPDDAAWLEQQRERLRDDELKLQHLPDRLGLLHMDLRSDNILFDRERGCVLLDWPFASWGPLTFDLIAFLITVEAEGGEAIESQLPMVKEIIGYELATENLRCALANLTGFFASHCIRPEIPALPRLRHIQRLCFRAALAALRRCS